MFVTHARLCLKRTEVPAVFQKSGDCILVDPAVVIIQDALRIDIKILPAAVSELAAQRNIAVPQGM